MKEKIQKQLEKEKLLFEQHYKSCKKHLHKIEMLIKKIKNVQNRTNKG
jgi:hypothetical protein